MCAVPALSIAMLQAIFCDQNRDILGQVSFLRSPHPAPRLIHHSIISSIQGGLAAESHSQAFILGGTFEQCERENPRSDCAAGSTDDGWGFSRTGLLV